MVFPIIQDNKKNHDSFITFKNKLNNDENNI